MADIDSLEALQGLHGALVAACEYGLGEGGFGIIHESLKAQAPQFKKLLDKSPRKKESRDAVQSGQIKVLDQDFSVNKQFQELALQLADGLDLDEVEAAKTLLDAEEDQVTLGRPLLECGIIRFHQRRKYLLDCMRLCIKLAEDDNLTERDQDELEEFVGRSIFGAPGPREPTPAANQRFVPRCTTAMLNVRAWLQKLVDLNIAASVMSQTNLAHPSDFHETMEFCRISLLQQHEVLAVLLCTAIEKRHADANDFRDFLQVAKRLDRYDHLLIHLFPVLGVYIRVYGSTEGVGDLVLARDLNQFICKKSDEDSWQIPFFRAAATAWWIAEYSGWYVDDDIGAPLDGIDIDEEDKERSKQFAEALKEGSFDFILSVATDVKVPDWQDPTRIGVQQWLQRKSPPLLTETAQFSDFFQTRLMEQLEFFIDAFISNLPDVLRRLRVEEDEQRQLSQAHEQDLDLERFLLMISHSYEARPEAADAFWSDPDSNLAGFLQWASRRASTPLVSAFCEMLQSISGNETCANAAHSFLLEDGQSSTAKIRRSQSLSWNQIFRELDFFTNKIRDRSNTPQSQTYRAGRPSTEQSETEPESAMMLECYLRLISRLSSNSNEARLWLLRNTDFTLVVILFQLATLPIPGRLRACIFLALKSLLTHKSQEESMVMWTCLDQYLAGGYVHPQSSHRTAVPGASPNSTGYMENMLEEIGRGFEQSNAFVQFLITLMSPVDGDATLNDALPFPENIGSSVRMSGVEPYVDFVLDAAFARQSGDLQDAQLRVLRLSCLEFALTCLETFNDDLILIGNESNIAVDAAISTTDLATYIRLHPFARVMEWMFNGRVVEAILGTIHQDSAEIGNASPDSPLIMGIIRAVGVISKVLEFQDTYLDLVRQVIRQQPGQKKPPVNHSAYTSFEECIVGHLDLIVDLGRACSLGHPALTLGCLKLLERISTSPRIMAAWNPGPGRQPHRNKAIVALEQHDVAESISGSLIAELLVPLDVGLEAEAPNYMVKTYILDFLYSCLEVSPDRPSIAHIFLGFRCGIDSLTAEPGSSFDSRTSLFHNLLRVLLEAPFGDDHGMRHWLVALKFKTMRVFQLLWRSPLSSSLVLNDLRENEFLFHILLREIPLQSEPDMPWDGSLVRSPDFLKSDGAMTFIEFLGLRAMTLEYIGIELCSVSQNRLPNLKRRIFDALSGRLIGDDNEPIAVPTIFDLYDFLPGDSQFNIAPPSFVYFKDLDLRMCVEEDSDSNAMYNLDRVREIILLKRAESGLSGQILTKDEETVINNEESNLMDYLILSNRQKQLGSGRLKVLRSWANLLLIMSQSNEFQDAAKVTFLVQALQAILPSLESYGPENPSESYELAKLAKVLLFMMDFTSQGQDDQERDRESRAFGSLVSDKLFQLFQTCLYVIGRWAGNSDLRAIYYSICYRYVTGLVDKDQGFLPGRQKTIKSIQLHGERVLNVICDDAYGGDLNCQTSALILLGAFVKLSDQEDAAQVIESLNRLNFIGVLVDSLKTLLDDSLAIIQSRNEEQKQYQDAKLSLLLLLCQTRVGAKYVLHANLFRAIELSALFTADPELQLTPTDVAALAQHYALLATVARVIGAAILSRGSHNVLQGRRFLTEHRMLVMHVLKRSAGIGSAAVPVLDEQIGELAEAFMVLITATGFVEFEDQGFAQRQQQQAPALFH